MTSARNPETLVPNLVLIPGDDRRLARLARLVLATALGTAEELERALRTTFPNVRVRPRELSSEPPTWYVYRDGNWYLSRSGGTP